MPLQTVLQTSIFLIADSTRGTKMANWPSPLLVSWKLAGVLKAGVERESGWT
jgi:hypothetical protein